MTPHAAHTSLVTPGPSQGWGSGSKVLVSVMMNPDFRQSCKIIYDPGSHTELEGGSENMYLWRMEESLAVSG